MTFNQFVEKVDKSSLTQFASDFVSDWKADQTKPNVTNKEEIRNYLVSQNACKEALEGLDSLWAAYETAGE